MPIDTNSTKTCDDRLQALPFIPTLKPTPSDNARKDAAKMPRPGKEEKCLSLGRSWRGWGEAWGSWAVYRGTR